MKKTKKTGICLIDTENSYSILANFGQVVRGGYISPENIIQDWNLYCAAWKFIGDKKVSSVCVNPKTPTDDRKVCLKLREVLEDVQLLIGHNVDRFDLKKINTRFIFHKIPPISHKILTLDTLKAAKKHFNFSSNRLDYLGTFLGFGGKLKNSIGNSWMKLIRNEDVAKTLKDMTKYCEHDVSPLLEKVYLRLRPYIDHPNLVKGMIITHGVQLCSHCGSGLLVKRGFIYTKNGNVKQRFVCLEPNCGGWSSEVKVD